MTKMNPEAALLMDTLPDPLRTAARRGLDRAHRRRDTAAAMVLSLLAYADATVTLLSPDGTVVEGSGEPDPVLTLTLSRLGSHDRAVVAGFLSAIEGAVAAATGGRAVVIDLWAPDPERTVPPPITTR